MRTSLFFLFVCFAAQSQNPGFSLLKSINGVEVYYKQTKTGGSAKKDDWRIELEYVNTGGSDLYYTAQKKEATYIDSTTEVAHFAAVTIGSTSIFNLNGDSAMLMGEKTRLATDAGDRIYRVRKGKTYTRTMSCRVDKDNEPQLTVRIVNNISLTDSLSDFL